MPRAALLSVLCLLLFSGFLRAEDKVSVDLTQYAEECGVTVRREGDRLRVRWPLEETDSKEFGSLTLNLTARKPLIESLAITPAGNEEAVALLHGIDPVTYLTVGTREAPRDHPPHISVWNR